MSKLPVHKLKTNAKELDLGDAKVFHLPAWGTLSHPQRLGILRQISMMRGRDPRIAKLAVKIFKDARVNPRDYEKQAAALLKWVQDPKNCYYANEPGERLQDPIHTIKIGHGDCDDQALLLTCLFESVGLPWKFVLSGRDAKGNKVRHIEGESVPPSVNWTHIYCMVGTPPFKVSKWWFCETTIVGVPLGWDVISGDASFLPEMMRQKGGPAQIVQLGKASSRWRTQPLPPPSQQSPAYAAAMGYGDGELVDDVGSEVGSYLAKATAEFRHAAQDVKQELKDPNVQKTLRTAILTGVAVSVCTSMIMQYINGQGFWEGQGHLFTRFGNTTSNLANNSRLFSFRRAALL